MRGRKPKPTKLKILNGSGRINESEPRPNVSIPQAPKFLALEAKREWDRITTELEPLGFLTQLDRGILTAYCVAWGRLARACNETNRGGILKRGKKKGGEYQNQWEAIVKRASAEVAKYGSLLGLDPTSRTRISVDASRPDAFENFLNDSAAS